MGNRSFFEVTRLRAAVAVGALVVSLLALVILLAPSASDDDALTAEATPAPTATQLAAAPATPATPAPSGSPATASPTAAATSLPATETPEGTASTVPSPAATASSTGVVSPQPSPPPTGPDVRLEIPSIGVDAWVIRMGLDTNGVMEVPRNGQLVAWYDFTSVPGAPGNAVMSAHLDYRGSTAVFWRLGDLRDGDRVIVVLEGEPIEYVVSRIYSTRPEDADLREIIGGRSGPETVTLITCGGIWDAAEGQYDHRVIVQAQRVV